MGQTGRRLVGLGVALAWAAGTSAGLARQDQPATTTGAGGGTRTSPGAGRPPVTFTPGPAPQPQPPGPEQPPPEPGAPEEDVTLANFSEAVELRALVEYVAETLGVNIVGSDSLSGSIAINAPVSVPRAQLIGLLDSLLMQQGFTITRDRSGVYQIVPIGEVDASLSGDLPTTRIIATPTIRPSSLRELMGHFGLTAALPGQPGQGTNLVFLDDLGVLVATAPTRVLDEVEAMVAEVLRRSAGQEFIRFEVLYVASGVARTRILEMLGKTAARTPEEVAMQQAMAVSGQGAATLHDLGDRLTLDAQGNALIFRGFPEEAEKVQRVLAVIDAPNNLEPRQYYAYSAATQVARIAKFQGLGEVQEIDTSVQVGPDGMPMQQPQPAEGQPGALATPTGGPVMVVDKGTGTILYYGTPAQHEKFAELLEKFQTQQDQIVIKHYKIKNGRAEDIADLLIGLLTNQQPGGNLLPESGYINQPGGSTGRGRGRRSRGGDGGQSSIYYNLNQQQPSTSPGGGVGFGAGTDTYVIPDVANNQVLVKAPQKMQAEFAELIERLDLRRPQVYIEAQIVAVTADDSFRLAVETQLTTLGDPIFGLNTNFGLGTLGPDFTDPKTINKGLSGLTSALILTDQVPIIINALKNETDARILSSPQLLVDDNEEAEIVSVEEQPTTETSQTAGNPNVTGFSGYEEAGTTLYVRPTISEGGYIRLDYEVELSNFVGSGADGVPPPKQTRNVYANTTLPSDTTIVVGGITVDATGTTIVKVPLIGDIPIVGHLFRDTTKAKRTTRLYIFITPRVMRDPTFRDLALLTEGPQAQSGLAPPLPPMEPTSIEIIGLPRPAEPEPPIPLPGGGR